MIPVFDIKSLRSRLSNVSSAVRLQRMRALSRVLSVRSAPTILEEQNLEEQKRSSTVVVPVEFDVLFHDRFNYFPKTGFYAIADGSTDVFEYLVERMKSRGERYTDRFVSDVYLSPESSLTDSYQIAKDDGIPYRVDVIFDRDDLEKNKEIYYNELTMFEYIFGTPDSASPQLSDWYITNFAEVYSEWDTWNPRNNIANMTRYKKVIDSALEKS